MQREKENLDSQVQRLRTNFDLLKIENKILKDNKGFVSSTKDWAKYQDLKRSYDTAEIARLDAERKANNYLAALSRAQDEFVQMRTERDELQSKCERQVNALNSIESYCVDALDDER